MEFVRWHYSKGISHYLKSWENIFESTLKYFSFPILFRTLFSPWKRLGKTQKSSGFNWDKFKDDLSFNFASRVVGFLTRTSLIVTAVIVLMFLMTFGVFGLLMWIMFPIASYSKYKSVQKRPEYFVADIVDKAFKSDNPTKNIFDNQAGKFVLDHLGLDIETVLTSSSSHIALDYSNKYVGYAQLLAHLIQGGLFSQNFWRDNDIHSDDMLLAAEIWDTRRLIESGDNSNSTTYIKGIGANLLFGYTPVIDQIGSDLIYERSKAPMLRGRDDVMARIDRILSSKSSMLLVGMPGVGKKTLLLELAKKLDKQYQRLVEVSIVKLTQGIADNNDKKVAIQNMLSEGASAGNVVIVLKNLERITNLEFEGVDYTDVFEEYLSKKNIVLIAISTPEEYEKYLSRNYRLMNYFEKVDLEPLSPEFATQVLIDRAAELESTQGVTIPIPVLRKMVITADNFSSYSPFPQKALELLEASVLYTKQNNSKIVTSEDVITVTSEKTGIPTIALTSQHKHKLANMESHLKEKLIGQDSAIRMISQSLRSRAMDVSTGNKPIGTFLFLGPTGVGKTETAKVLSNVYYGHDDIMRFDMGEYIGMEGLIKLIGSLQMNQPGILTTAIRNKPAGMILFDELEKASKEVFNVLLPLIDEGYIVDAFGRKVDCRNTFVISTSNAGSDLINQLIAQGTTGDELNEQVLDYIIRERIFSPEFINRFDGVVVYQPLTYEELTKVASIKLNILKSRMAEKNIFVELHESLPQKVAIDGYHPTYGARPMNRVVNMTIADLISQAMLSEQVKPGDRVILLPGNEKLEYRLQKI
ncbi:ATP-dependent Clp protease ATP-binding subunit [Candidatus Woesebacteria bacterium]|nr:MAG: ATP-dependent Clp protease ATP-binding subunit [Candidatus Woesebacteria bacterium]